TLTGTAEANATVAILANGTQIGTADADDDGNWSFTIGDANALPDGEVNFTATATDAAGNVSPASPSFTLNVDTVDPMAPAIDPTNGDIITGTAEPGSTVTLTDDAGNAIGDPALVDGDGNWSVTPSDPLADGDTINATATDAAGNTSDPATAIVDTAAPNAGDNDIEINDGGDGFLNADEAGNVTLSGSLESDATVSSLIISDASGNTVTVDPADITVDADGNLTTNGVDLSGLTDGELTATLSVTDAAGNTGTVTDTSTLDSVAPEVPTPTLAVDTATDGDGITRDPMISVDGLEGEATWEYSTDGGDSWTPGTGTAFELPEGDYAAGAVQVRQTDAAGNTSGVGNLGAVTIDVTDPV
ncbi:Ig-like domain-containing protein, partial [Salinicola socius]